MRTTRSFLTLLATPLLGLSLAIGVPLSATAGSSPTAAAEVAMPLRIDSGPTPAAGWLSDRYVTGGSVLREKQRISVAGVTDPADAEVYATARSGNFTYTIPGLLPNRRYDVRLHFVEPQFPSGGKRSFDVRVNGALALDDYDIAAVAKGRDKAVITTLSATARADGTIELAFTGVKHSAIVSALEIIPVAILSSSPDLKIMAVGDSITWGIGGEVTGGYRLPLWNALKALKWSFTPVGFWYMAPYPPYTTDDPYNGSYWSGWSAWSMNDLMLDYTGTEPHQNTTGKDIDDWIAEYQPDVMLLHIGTNDLAFHDSDELLRADFTKLLDKMIADRPQAHIFVAKIINYVVGPVPYLTRYNAMIEDVVAARRASGAHVHLVDMASALDKPEYYADYAHPNVEGYAVMAKVWLEALQAVDSGRE